MQLHNYQELLGMGRAMGTVINTERRHITVSLSISSRVTLDFRIVTSLEGMRFRNRQIDVLVKLIQFFPNGITESDSAEVILKKMLDANSYRFEPSLLTQAAIVLAARGDEAAAFQGERRVAVTFDLLDQSVSAMDNYLKQNKEFRTKKNKALCTRGRLLDALIRLLKYLPFESTENDSAEYIFLRMAEAAVELSRAGPTYNEGLMIKTIQEATLASDPRSHAATESNLQSVSSSTKTTKNILNVFPVLSAEAREHDLALGPQWGYEPPPVYIPGASLESEAEIDRAIYININDEASQLEAVAGNMQPPSLLNSPAASDDLMSSGDKNKSVRNNRLNRKIQF